MHNVLSTVKWILIILMILGWLFLCVANRESVSDFVLIPGQLPLAMPMSVILIFPFVVSFLGFWVVGFLDQVDHFLQARELKKRIRDLESEVNQLRNLPIREGLLSQRAVEEENRH